MEFFWVGFFYFSSSESSLLKCFNLRARKFRFSKCKRNIFFFGKNMRNVFRVNFFYYYFWFFKSWLKYGPGDSEVYDCPRTQIYTNRKTARRSKYRHICFCMINSVLSILSFISGCRCSYWKRAFKYLA